MPVLEFIASNLDLAAFAWFVLGIMGYRLVAGFGPLERRSIVGAVQRQREAWMRNMVGRDGRIVDVHLLGTLGQGNAFFASTSALIIGGLSALLGSGEKVQTLIERLPYVAKSPAVLIEIKLLLIIGIFIYSFFKFAWAFRLSHYAAIMIGSTPLLEKDESNLLVCKHHATRTARLVGIAAEHSNSGLRGYYYAIAGMAWFFHPWAFIFATTWVVLILLRRDFFSRSRRLLAA